MIDDENRILAEQFIEVSVTENFEYTVDLVVESFAGDEEEHVLRHNMGTYGTLKQADEMADSLRWVYDKMIYKYNLM
jgi:hypothetical protein